MASKSNIKNITATIWNFIKYLSLVSIPGFYSIGSNPHSYCDNFSTVDSLANLFKKYVPIIIPIEIVIETIIIKDMWK